jgi:hypothetical protein
MPDNPQRVLNKRSHVPTSPHPLSPYFCGVKNIQSDMDPGLYRYDLPQGRIAQHPLAERDLSKLLVMDHRGITSGVFRELSGHLPAGAMLLFNDTKVIRARMAFRKATGAAIEVFFLNPLEPSADHEIAFAQGSPAVWECVIGNARNGKRVNWSCCFRTTVMR